MAFGARDHEHHPLTYAAPEGAADATVPVQVRRCAHGREALHGDDHRVRRRGGRRELRHHGHHGEHRRAHLQGETV